MMKRIALTFMLGLSSAFVVPATAAAEEKPVVDETKDAEGEVGTNELQCQVVVGTAWVATGSCLGGGTRYRERWYSYCYGEWFEWGEFSNRAYCSNNPPQTP